MRIAYILKICSTIPFILCLNMETWHGRLRENARVRAYIYGFPSEPCTESIQEKIHLETVGGMTDIKEVVY